MIFSTIKMCENLDTGSDGNFIELLNYRARGGDKELKKHLESYSKNASNTSKTTLNELIQCCGENIKENLLQDIKKANIIQL